MKRVFLVTIAFALTGTSCATQRQRDFTKGFIKSLESGNRVRHLLRQIRLKELQRKQFEAEVKRAEQAQQQGQKRAAQPTGQPTQQQLEQIKKQTDMDLQVLSARHPDWKKYEPRMVYFASRLLPQNISALEYLEYLYILAKATESQAVEK